jgi:hypothetical protein
MDITSHVELQQPLLEGLNPNGEQTRQDHHWLSEPTNIFASGTSITPGLVGASKVTL